jgi:hypothetical protein
MVECPFCRSELSPGRVAVRTMDWWAPMAVVWKPDVGHRAEWQHVFSPGLLRRGTRPASYCYGCDAVVVHPPEAV